MRDFFPKKMKMNTEPRMTILKTVSITKTLLIPIPAIHGSIAKTKAVATMLRVIVSATIVSATICSK